MSRTLWMLIGFMLLFQFPAIYAQQSFISGEFDFQSFTPKEGDTIQYYFQVFTDELGNINRVRRYDKSKRLFNIDISVIENNNFESKYSVILFRGINAKKNESTPMRGYLHLFKEKRELYYIATRNIPNAFLAPQKKLMHNEIQAIFKLDDFLFPVTKYNQMGYQYYKTAYIYDDYPRVKEEKCILMPCRKVEIIELNSAMLQKLTYNDCLGAPFTTLFPEHENIDIPIWLLYPYFYR